MTNSETKPKKRSRLVRILLIITAVLVAASAAFVWWANDTNPVMAEALAALQSDATVQVSQEPWITFQPAQTSPSTAVIYYPGGKVDARAYAPTMRSLAEAGYLTVIVPMPLNLAFTGINKAEEVMAAYPEIETWVLSGHSLGGAMAANYVYAHPDQLDGLILYASYPAENNSLAGAELPVLSIYGTEDGGIDKLRTSARLLPPDAKVVVIEGGNHAQFGYYGLQDGDGTATISRTEQQAQSLEATLNWLESLPEP